MKALEVANEKRSREASAVTCARVRQALKVLGSDAPARCVEAGRLRLTHPTASLRELAALADPPMTKDTIAGLLRRLLKAAAEREAVG